MGGLGVENKWSRYEDSVIVLGGGASVLNFDVENIDKHGCYVIGANDAFRGAPVDCVVSMDRKFLEGRWDELMEFSESHPESNKDKPVFLRENAYRVNMKPRRFYGLNTFGCDHESDHFADTEELILNGRSSGHCAMNLAYKMRPRTVYLFGFDMQGGYWWPPYPWASEPTGKRSDAWIGAFEQAESYFVAQGTKVYVVGPSAVPNFQKLSFSNFKTLVKL